MKSRAQQRSRSRMRREIETFYITQTRPMEVMTQLNNNFPEFLLKVRLKKSTHNVHFSTRVGENFKAHYNCTILEYIRDKFYNKPKAELIPKTPRRHLSLKSNDTEIRNKE